jgi:hypothetical protein
MKTIRDYITIVENNIDERVAIPPDGNTQVMPIPQPAPNSAQDPGESPITNVKSGGAQVEFGGQTYDVMVFGDKSIRPRISGSDKAVSAKAYTKGNKMFVLLDAELPGGSG